MCAASGLVLRCWRAGLLLASVVSGRALLLLVGVVSVRREEEEEEEEEEEFFNQVERCYSVSVLCRLERCSSSLV